MMTHTSRLLRTLIWIDDQLNRIKFAMMVAAACILDQLLVHEMVYGIRSKVNM